MQRQPGDQLNFVDEACELGSSDRRPFRAVRLKVPKDLSDGQRELLEEFADEENRKNGRGGERIGANDGPSTREDEKKPRHRRTLYCAVERDARFAPKVQVLQGLRHTRLLETSRRASPTPAIIMLPITP